jgi:hypothetical protein
MFSYETDHKRFAYDAKNRLYNTWIHPNEEKVLPCKLYKSNGEEFSMQVLYEQANPAHHLPTAGDAIAG